jgi:hypothetical protein
MGLQNAFTVNVLFGLYGRMTYKKNCFGCVANNKSAANMAS